MRRWMLAPAVIALVVLAGCTPSPDSEAPAEPPSAPSSEPSDAVEPEPEPLTLPDCDSIYSPALVAQLEAEGRTSEGDVSALGPGGFGTFDVGVETILAAITPAVHCTWILPASESGSTTSIALLDDASRTALVAAFAGSGFTATTAPSGDLYSISVAGELTSYTESHLLTADVWIGSAYAGGDASVLTLDAAAQLLP